MLEELFNGFNEKYSPGEQYKEIERPHVSNIDHEYSLNQIKTKMNTEIQKLETLQKEFNNLERDWRKLHKEGKDTSLGRGKCSANRVSQQEILKNVDNIEYSANSRDICDTYIDRAEFNGVEMTDEEIEILNNDNEFIYESYTEA